jgi:hypothetical protein
MKSVFAILFTVLLLMNVMGYYGVFMGLQYKNSLDLTYSLDSERYSQENTITFKIPVAIPYHVDDIEYQRIDGTVIHQGVYYRLVKQKLMGDTLSVVCLRDDRQTEIKGALTDYVKTFADHATGSGQHHKGTISFIKDFTPTSVGIMSSITGWSKALEFAHLSQTKTSRFVSVFTPPPQSCC